MRFLVILRDALLTVTAALGVVSIAVLIAGTAFQIKPLVVVSGSMEPGIPTGSLIFSQKVDASEVEIGDIVTVPKRTGNALVTHRVVRIEDAPVGRELFLRGDANDTDDPYTYVVQSVQEHRYTIPSAGYAVNWVQSRTGVITLGAVGAAVVILMIGTRGQTRSGKSAREAKETTGSGTSQGGARHADTSAG